VRHVASRGRECVDVKEKVPLKVPLPALTDATASADDDAARMFHADGRASASAAVPRIDIPERIKA
jgi:hypothetical protein